MSSKDTTNGKSLEPIGGSYVSECHDPSPAKRVATQESCDLSDPRSTTTLNDSRRMKSSLVSENKDKEKFVPVQPLKTQSLNVPREDILTRE